MLNEKKLIFMNEFFLYRAKNLVFKSISVIYIVNIKTRIKRVTTSEILKKTIYVAFK
jgi:hypothetical protein